MNDTRRQCRAIVATVAIAVSASTVCAASGREHPAVAAGKAGCVTGQCHAQLLGAAAGAKAGSVHDPASGGECASCHDLALAAAARFVKGAPSGPGEEAGRAGAWDQELCLGCHGEELLTTATGFADGKRNLHALHVQAGRGRRCLPCHDPHAARQPELLRERIPARGGAQISQEFRGEPDGGWCRTGCHAPKRYRR